MYTAFFSGKNIWKQTKCPLMDDLIKKTCYIPTVVYYSTIRKDIWNNIDEFGRHYGKQNKPLTEEHILPDTPYKNCLTSSNLQKQSVEYWLPVATSKENEELMFNGHNFSIM